MEVQIEVSAPFTMGIDGDVWRIAGGGRLERGRRRGDVSGGMRRGEHAISARARGSGAHELGSVGGGARALERRRLRASSGTAAATRELGNGGALDRE